MHKNEIIVLVAVLFALGFRLYKKYANKEKGTNGSKQSGTSFPSSSKDDDYEPYSKK